MKGATEGTARGGVGGKPKPLGEKLQVGAPQEEKGAFMTVEDSKKLNWAGSVSGERGGHEPAGPSA